MKVLKEIDQGGKDEDAKSPHRLNQEIAGKDQRKDTIIFPDRRYGKDSDRYREERIAEAGERVEVDLDFDDVEFKEVARVFLGKILRVSYTIAPNVKGKVSVKFKGNLNRGDYLGLFQSLCDIYDWVLLRDGEIYKVLPRKEMHKMAIPVRARKEGEISGKRWVTQILPLKYADAQEAVSFLRHFARPGALVLAPDNARVVIIVDTAESADLYHSLVDTLDVPFFTGKGIRFYDIKKLDAKTMASELEKVVFALGGGVEGKNSQLTFIPIQEANKLLVVTSTPEIFPQVDAIINNIDQIDQNEGTKIFFHRLQNVKAKDVLTVLKQLFRKKIADIKRPDYIEIIADDSTNSLIIQAMSEDYMQMKTTIEDLDAYPLQVLIRIVIAEVILGEDEQYGIEWWASGKVGGGILELTAFPNLPLVTTNMFSAYFLKDADLYSLLKMVASKSEVNILSSPHIMVRNGREAKIEIGEDVPLLKAQVTSEEGTQTKDSIDYQSTGIKMLVTPTISKKGYVTLDIQQEVSSAQYNIPALPKSPVITKRVTETSLTIEDGKTVLLAGIIQEKRENKDHRVPVLSKIPLLGNLFKTASKSGSKTELMIAITTNIVRDQGEAELLTQKFASSLKAIKECMPEFDIQSLSN